MASEDTLTSLRIKKTIGSSEEFAARHPELSKKLAQEVYTLAVFAPRPVIYDAGLKDIQNKEALLKTDPKKANEINLDELFSASLPDILVDNIVLHYLDNPHEKRSKSNQLAETVADLAHKPKGEINNLLKTIKKGGREALPAKHELVKAIDDNLHSYMRYHPVESEQTGAPEKTPEVKAQSSTSTSRTF